MIAVTCRCGRPGSAHKACACGDPDCAHQRWNDTTYCSLCRSCKAYRRASRLALTLLWARLRLRLKRVPDNIPD